MRHKYQKHSNMFFENYSIGLLLLVHKSDYSFGCREKHFPSLCSSSPTKYFPRVIYGS